MRWKAASSAGYSTPIVASGRVLFTERRGDVEVIRALEADTGSELWSTSYSAPYTVHRFAKKHGDGPKATPTVVGSRVVSFGISGILCVLRVTDGRLLWKRDLGVEYDSLPVFGAAASPLVVEGRVILPVGDEENDGALIAFDLESGEIRWRAFRDGPSYSSPIVATLAGIRQVISFTAGHVVGVALEDGRELWSYPVALPWNETIVTPMIWSDRVIVAGRNQGGTRALRPRAVADRVAVDEVWVSPSPVYMSSPVIVGDHEYALEHQTGKLFCLRLEDGVVTWKEGDFGDCASLVVAGGRLLVLDSGGRLTVLEANPSRLDRVVEYRVSDRPTYAHLVVVGSRLLVRDSESIRCFDLAPEVTFLQEPGRVKVAIGGEAVATYVFDNPSIPRPHFVDLKVPGGIQVTRNHPPRPGDFDDHPTMHPGLWLAFGELGGEDFWRLRARVVHQRFINSPRGGPGEGGFEVENRYVASDGKTVVCRETCSYAFVVAPSGFLLCTDSRFVPELDGVAFGDQEEMGFGVRVATSLAVKRQQGGRILNGDGSKNERGTWGRQSAWCDYSGPAGGVALFPHPGNFRTSWFHARDYGLLVANPFGRAAMKAGAESRVPLGKDEALRLRFAAFVHGELPRGAADLQAAFQLYVLKSVVTGRQEGAPEMGSSVTPVVE